FLRRKVAGSKMVYNKKNYSYIPARDEYDEDRHIAGGTYQHCTEAKNGLCAEHAYDAERVKQNFDR
ncbi:MAG TPA: hypothetical protein VN512_01615, partial [Clostridia bacterium]|nr:hypothetical protein [Clostridia bacterium]